MRAHTDVDHGVRSATSMGLVVLIVVGLIARSARVSTVWDSSHNWRMPHDVAASSWQEVTEGDKFDETKAPKMFLWEDSCLQSYPVAYTRPTTDKLTLEDSPGPGNGVWNGYKRSPELTRQPVSAITSLAFVGVAVLAAARGDGGLVVGSAAVAAGSYSWHSTGTYGGRSMDYYGCILYMAALIASLMYSSGVPEPLAQCVGVLVVLSTGMFSEANLSADYAAYMLGAVLVVAAARFAFEHRAVPFGHLNLAAAGVVGLLLHAEVDEWKAACTNDLDVDLANEMLHSAWHCCTAVMGVEALLIRPRTTPPTPSLLSAMLSAILFAALAPGHALWVVPLCLMIAFAGEICWHWWGSKAKSTYEDDMQRLVY